LETKGHSDGGCNWLNHNANWTPSLREYRLNEGTDGERVGFCKQHGDVWEDPDEAGEWSLHILESPLPVEEVSPSPWNCPPTQSSKSSLSTPSGLGLSSCMRGLPCIAEET
jgi:hypothetical protein